MSFVVKGLIVGALVGGAYWAGCNDSVSETEIIDPSGRTTITIIMGDPDGGNWTELRGPGRFDALNDIMHSVGPDEPTDRSGRDSIIVQYADDGDWCELRGPARWVTLEYIEDAWVYNE